MQPFSTGGSSAAAEANRRGDGQAVNRSPGHDESPFADHADEGEDIEQTVRDLIAEGEGGKIEFKSTGRKNLHTGKKDPAIEWSVVKSIAAS